MYKARGIKQKKIKFLRSIIKFKSKLANKRLKISEISY